MFKWLSEKRDLNFAKKGSIGGTADFFCIGYWSCIQSITLEEKWAGLRNTPESKAGRAKELNNLFDFMLTARFQSFPDESQESKIRNQELTKFGAFSFIASILKVEADLHLNDDYWTGIFFKVIAKALQDQQIPSWVVKGDSLEEWDPVKVLNFFQEAPR
tara:strand:+ start:200 stop:679 length:480 start_codon:yes stop_codon:yes gene_type:complete